MNSYKQIAIDTESGAWFGVGEQKGLGQDRTCSGNGKEQVHTRDGLRKDCA